MLIGLHGVAQSGKDTIYSMIAEDFGDAGTKVVRDAFADRLKVSAARALGFKGTPAQCIDWCNDLKVSGQITSRLTLDAGRSHYFYDTISGREFLQYYGTEAHRDVFGKDFWTDAVLPNWQDDDYGRHDGLTRNDILVITDVRFINEAERILDCNGSIWHVIRKEVQVGDAHASEQPLPPEYIDYTIENNSTLDALRAKVHFGVWAEISKQAAHA